LAVEPALPGFELIACCKFTLQLAAIFSFNCHFHQEVAGLPVSLAQSWQMLCKRFSSLRYTCTAGAENMVINNILTSFRLHSKFKFSYLLSG
jgi:hypothetical protein